MLDAMEGVRLGGDAGQIVWAERFNEDVRGHAPLYRNAGSRKQARAYALGLLSGTKRTNGWTLAEFAGTRAPTPQT